MGKSKKKLAEESLLPVLMKTLPSSLSQDDCKALAAGITEAIDIMVGKKKTKDEEKTQGAQVWDAYAEAYKKRWQVEPVRNATTNNQAKQLVARVGFEPAIELVRFYMIQTDAFYVRSMHQLGICLKDCEMLYTRLRSGQNITKRAAEKIETAGATIGASSSYLSRKYGPPQSETPKGEDK